jgi:hypothetical protein
LINLQAPLSTAGEERVIQRSEDRVSFRRQAAIIAYSTKV